MRDTEDLKKVLNVSWTDGQATGNVSSSILKLLPGESGKVSYPLVFFLHLKTSEDKWHSFFAGQNSPPVTKPKVSKHWREWWDHISKQLSI